jgi:hypothetical protein
MNLRRTLCAGSVVVAIFVVGEMTGRFSARSEAQVAPAAAPARSAAEIARERLKVADEGLKIVEKQQRIGVASPMDQTNWVLRRARAAADLPDRAERIAILEDCVKQMNQKALQVQDMNRAAVANMSDVQSAKFDALEVELLLAKAR